MFPRCFAIVALFSTGLAFAAQSQAPGHYEVNSHPYGPSTFKNNDDSWLGWGANIFNNRAASSHALVDSSNVRSLHSFCTQDYSLGITASPLVVDGVAYYPTWSGLLVALDYAHCKVLWETNVTEISLAFKPVDATILSFLSPGSRTTPAIEGDVLYIGTLANALVLALNKKDGKMIDKIQLSSHPLAIVTQSPTVWQGTIFVGVASSEETAVDEIPGYKCCSFIGSMHALRLRHGKFVMLWTQTMIPAGIDFSGAAIWGAQPSIDPSRHQVFIGTGNVYSAPPFYEACRNSTTNSTTVLPEGNTTDPCTPPKVYQENVLALDTRTGTIIWSRQLSPLDAWNVACLKGIPLPITDSGDCPSSPGPDADFGMAPSFVPGSASTPGGEDVVVIGQKNGNLYALGAKNGKLKWATATSPDGAIGGLIWGIAVDSTQIYYTAANSQRTPWRLQNGTPLSNSAFGAASLSTGKILWETPTPHNMSSSVPPSVANDVVLVGASDSVPSEGLPFPIPPGRFTPLDKRTGRIIVDRVLDGYFQGGIGAVGGWIMFGTGSASFNGSFNVWKVGR